MKDLLPRLPLPTSPDTRSAISLPGSADGPTRSSSPACLPLPGSGQAARPASRLALPESSSDSSTSATSPPPLCVSSRSADLLCSSGNRLPLPSTNVTSKACTVCRQIKSLTEFRKYSGRSPDGHRPLCKECQREYEKGWRKEHFADIQERRKKSKQAAREYSVQYRLENRAKYLIAECRRRCARKGVPFDLDQYEAQIQERMTKGLCELSKIPLDLTSPKRTAFTPSLDRIEAGGPYTIDNVRIVCWGINALLGDWGEQTALKICSALLTKQDRQTASERLQASLTERLKSQLDQVGSTIYSLSWKEKVTPAGRQYCQRQASVPRTNEIDFSLVPWATPHTSASTGAGTQGRAGGMNIQTMAALAGWPTVTTIDNNQVQGEAAAANHPARGTTLGGASRLASWPTPTTRDHKDGAECLNVPINSLLGRQVWQASWATPTASMKVRSAEFIKNRAPAANEIPIVPIRVTASGQMLTGSDAGMENSGQLRPGHSRWLMGFPIDWDAAAIRALEKPLKKLDSRLVPTSRPVSPVSEGTEMQSCHRLPRSS